MSAALFLAFVSIGVIIGKSNLDFAWKMIIATGIIIFGHQMVTFKLPGSTTTNWPNYVRFYGWTTLMAVLLFSNIGARGRSIVNEIDRRVGNETLTCPDHKVVLSIGTEMTMRSDCDLVVVVPEALQIGKGTETVLAEDEVAAGLVQKDNYYFTSTWEDTKKGEIRFVPNPAKFKEANRDEIRFVVRWQSKSCPTLGVSSELIQVSEGRGITVQRDCPLYIDQRQFAATGFILDAVNPRFKEMKPGQLINTSQVFPGVEKYPQCVVNRQGKVTGNRCHVVQIAAVGWAFNELGLTELELIVRKPKPEEFQPRLQ